MIWQSGPWKQDLIDLFETCERQYRDLGDLAERGWWEDAVRAQQVEKAVFLSAFIVRKLIESFRLSVQAESETLQVLAFPLRERERLQHASNWDDLHRWYDLDAGRAQSVPLRKLANWAIHSFTFVAEVDEEDNLSGFYLNSDRSRSTELLRVDWAEYRRALQVIAADDVVWSWTLRGRSGSQLELRSNTPLDLEQQADWARAHERVIAELQAE